MLKLDLKTAGGLQKALDLAARSAVVIESFRPAVMERPGLGLTQNCPDDIVRLGLSERRVMDDRARIYEINKILKMHGLDHGKREAAFDLLWIVLHPNSKSTLTKTMCDDGSILRFQRWTLSNNASESEMKVELS